MKRVFYYFLLIIFRFISLLPFWLLYVISDFLYFLTYYIVRYRKKVVFDNLKNAFPGKSDKEIKTIAQKFYKNFCDVLIESVKNLTITGAQLSKRIKFINPEILQELYDKNKSSIVVAAHYGNWEWAWILAPKHTKHKCYALYNPFSNKLFDDLLSKTRANCGVNMIPMKSAYKTMLKNRDEPSLYYSISDQSPHVNKIEYRTTFLNQDTPVFLGPEKIAKALDFPVIFLRTKKIKRGHYEIEFIKIVENSKETAQYEITEKHISVLEDIIKENPENWLWSHKRWKY